MGNDWIIIVWCSLKSMMHRLYMYVVRGHQRNSISGESSRRRLWARNPAANYYYFWWSRVVQHSLVHSNNLKVLGQAWPQGGDHIESPSGWPYRVTQWVTLCGLHLLKSCWNVWPGLHISPATATLKWARKIKQTCHLAFSIHIRGYATDKEDAVSCNVTAELLHQCADDSDVKIQYNI